MRHNKAREIVIVALTLASDGHHKQAQAALNRLTKTTKADLDEVIEELDNTATAAFRKVTKAAEDEALDNLDGALEGGPDDTVEADTDTIQLTHKDAVLDAQPGPDDTKVAASDDEDEDEEEATAGDDEDEDEEEATAQQRALARLAKVNKNRAVLAKLRSAPAKKAKK